MKNLIFISFSGLSYTLIVIANGFFSKGSLLDRKANSLEKVYDKSNTDINKPLNNFYLHSHVTLYKFGNDTLIINIAEANKHIGEVVKISGKINTRNENDKRVTLQIKDSSNACIDVVLKKTAYRSYRNWMPTMVVATGKIKSIKKKLQITITNEHDIIMGVEVN